MSDNWVIQNLENSLGVWNEKLAEIWTIITQSPQTFKDGAIWSVITDIHGALQALSLIHIFMSDHLEAMKNLRDFLAEHHITNVATDSYTLD